MNPVGKILGEVDENNVVSKTVKKTIHDDSVAKTPGEVVDNIL